MRLALLASVAALGLGSGTASAQYPVLVPHRNHYHVVPSSPTYPAYGGGGLSIYAADRTGTFGLSIGRPYTGFGCGTYYGGGWGGYGGGWNGYHHHHHHHGYGW